MNGKRLRFLAAVLAAVMALAFAACETTPQSKEVIPGVGAENYPRVDGSTANLPLLAGLYSKITGVPLEEAETMVNISGGTGVVWRNMMYENVDLLVVYEAPEAVKADLEASGLALEILPVGVDALVFLVNTENKVDGLSQEELRDVYTGAITDWSQLGGEAGPIMPFQRNEESGSQTLFLKLLMKNTPPMEAPTELVPAGMGMLIDQVASYDGSGGAIGYSVFYYADLMYNDPNLKLLAVDGVAPSAETIGDGSYPLTNQFYVVIRADEPEDSPARMLRDWLLSEQGSALLEEYGYLPAK